MPELDDLLDDSNPLDSDLVKSLRKALKDANKELKDAREVSAKAAKESRSRSLTDVFKDKGLSEKAAKLYPSDAEPTAEAVDAWLGEYGELFGIEKQETVAGSETQQAAGRISQASASAPPAVGSFDPEALAAAISAAQTPEALADAMASAGITFS